MAVSRTMGDHVMAIKYPMIARFWDKVIPEPMSGCWLWIGAIKSNGYGVIRNGARGTGYSYAHRYAYIAFRGLIPAGAQIDHLCRLRCCVNPDHLEPVSCRENLRRGTHPNIILHRNRTCKQGHFLNPENSYYQADGRQFCKTCSKRRR